MAKKYSVKIELRDFNAVIYRPETNLNNKWIIGYTNGSSEFDAFELLRDYLVWGIWNNVDSKDYEERRFALNESAYLLERLEEIR